MNYKNRSENYNWFKQNNNIKTPKNQMKMVWKIFKVFIYLSLFVFSMVGCVQSFVIGTSNYVGRGIELYASESEVIPNVSEIYVDKYKTKDLIMIDDNKTSNDTTDDVYHTLDNVYQLKLSTSTNTMIKPNDKDSDGNRILENVHETIKNQNIKNNLKLSDAYRGINETIRFATSKDDNLKVNAFDTQNIIDKYSDSNLGYIALSSKADDLNGVGASSDNDEVLKLIHGTDNNSTDASIYYYGRKYIEEDETNIDKYDDDPSTKDKKEDFWGKVKNSTDKFVHKVKIDKEYKWYRVEEDLSSIYMYEYYKTYFSILDKSTKTKITTLKTNSIQGARDKFRILVLNEIYNRDKSNEMSIGKFLLTNPEKLNETTDTTWFYESDKNGVKGKALSPSEITNAMRARFNLYQQSFISTFAKSYLLGSHQKLETNENEYFIRLFSGDMVVFGTKQTDYRPIVTWGQAWKLGPFYGLFVFPLGKISTLMISTFPIMNGWGAFWSILIIVLMSRLLTFLLSFKSTLQQTKMQEMNAKKAVIDAKYAPYKGNKQMENRQKQEVAELYKKEGINPIGAMGNMFLTMPMFLSIWRIVSGVPMLKAATWLGMTFATTSYKALLSGQWQYLWLILLSGLVQFLSMYFPRLLTKKRDKTRINKHEEEAMKKNNKTQNIMTVVMIVMAVAFSAGVQVYWVIGGLWRILEVYLTHIILKKKSQNKKKGIPDVPLHKKFFKKKEIVSET